MFLKKLTISSNGRIIRDIPFHSGLNLIVDETPEAIQSNKTNTGNNVGKTTVLQLIDFCLGGNPKGIYLDPDTKRNEYVLVKDFLVKNRVLITLILVEDIADSHSQEIVIERNFLSRKDIIRSVNGENQTEDAFEPKISKLAFPGLIVEKPTFRQLISHNIRYRDEIINSTLRTLDKFTTDVEYETLHLFMLGVDFNKGDERQSIIARLRQEDAFRSRLERKQTRTAYETALALLENDIKALNTTKENFNLNENFEADLDRLNELKYRINRISSDLSNLKVKHDLISEAVVGITESISAIDLNQIYAIYQQASQKISGLQKEFEDLVQYHNRMADEKIRYISKELPDVQRSIEQKSEQLRSFLDEEKKQAALISKTESFEALEKIVIDLNEKYRQKGEYESIIQQLSEVESTIKDLNRDLGVIDSGLFSDEFELKIKDQINKFNTYFSNISRTLYGEQYALKYDIVTNRAGRRVYKFSSFNLNFSSGKKQGEISCFDIAYILFADAERIPTFHFLLNDKKELMHDNQLVNIAELVSKNGIQFVASILRDKLPSELNNEKYFVVKLSQSDKLFRIEGSQQANTST